MPAVQFSTLQIVRIVLLGTIAILVCMSFLTLLNDSSPRLREVESLSFNEPIGDDGRQGEDDDEYDDTADDVSENDEYNNEGHEAIADADHESNHQEETNLNHREAREDDSKARPQPLLRKQSKPSPAAIAKPAESGKDKHKFKSIEEVFENVQHDPSIANMVNIGDRPVPQVFQNYDQNKTERIWFYCHDPNYLRCMTRNDHDHVILDLCIPVHSWRQQWMFTPEGQIGTFYKGFGEYCLTADHLNMVVVGPCRTPADPSQQWEFQSGKGLIHKLTGYCVVANEGYTQTNIAPCNYSSVQWFMKFTNNLRPHPEDWKIWSQTFLDWRQEAVDKNKPYVQQAAARSLAQIENPIKHEVNRRVVVFYQPPRYRDIVTQIRWWLLAYKKLGLDEAAQRFDVIIYGHLDMLGNISRDYGCEEKPLDADLEPPAESSKGVCWMIPFVGASEREPEAYDGWFNSIEVLINKDTRPFLSKWRLILRADADTFPTPGMRDYWVDDVFMGRNAGYNNHYSQAMLKKASEEGGLKYKGIMNIASSYYGPSDSVLRIADLTVAAGRYLRVHLFSIATGCKLTPFLRPKGLKCEWGSGLWEGVMLLYSQEVAVNHLLSIGDDIRFFKEGQMDIITTSRQDVCKYKMLHVYHSDDRFSKHHFIVGNYKKLDMGEYDLRASSDYSTWFALTANNEGLNGDRPLARIGGDFKTLCD
eukprot:TRINITY_DN12680_c0_g2_i2.p1 TRINITY_DN12680_c0_g2~~TRINITY_DN12680_c0_g2_i2.p1  ORF type:complete len:702 (+),score=142.78 TRINITY_DN12680_c0_g2_i2:160-2265(+)